MVFDRLWKLRRERKKLEKSFDRLISQAKGAGDYDKEERLISELLFHRDSIDDEINVIESTRLQETANVLGIPVPKPSDENSWERGSQSFVIFLDVKARLQLRREIRRERRERWEHRTYWLRDIFQLAPKS
jgi:hypothetical protein